MKKRVVTIVLAGCLILSTVACGAKESGKNKEGKVKIQFMHSMVEQERQEVVDELIEKFEDENAGIEVEQIPVNEDAYETKVTALGTSGELPAVMELGQDFAKTNAKNEFIDFKSVKSVIDKIGQESFYGKVLDIVKTEDGENYTGVPVSGWVQGIFYNKKMLQEKGFEAPENWEDIRKIAEAFCDKDNKKYGIAIPTVDGVFSEQVFSQFALSNDANVFDVDGNVVFDTPEMTEAFEYYKMLSEYTMPGSNDTTEVKDAFMNGSVPMALYSTYLLPAIYEEGMTDQIGFAVPTNKSAATFGTVSVLSISADLKDEEREAAEKFVAFMMEDENNIKWLHMSPGGLQPVLNSVAQSESYMDNEVIKSFEAISQDISDAFNNLQIFGSVDGKNFLDMGDVTRKGVISKAINDITVNGKDIAETIKNAQKEIEEIVE